MVLPFALLYRYNNASGDGYCAFPGNMKFVPHDCEIVIPHQLRSFTPVRRREVFQCDSPFITTTTAWTTTRCKRLLRPLSSRVTSLRKRRQFQLPRVSAPECLVKEDRENLSTKLGRSSLPMQEPHWPSSGDTKDPDWTPDDVPRKRLKRTYSGRGGNHKEEVSASQNYPIVTALASAKIQIKTASMRKSKSSTAIAGKGLYKQAGTVYQEHTSTDDVEGTIAPIPPIVSSVSTTVQNCTRDSFRQLAKSVSPSDWMLEAGLYTDLDALLKATTGQRPRSTVGTRSLFATCLRKVPEYIAEEQHWADQEDKDSARDVTTAIYSDLELFGSCQDGGWKPLRVITRAHGIAILGDAIKDGSIRPALARGLVILCLQASAFEEAERLCDCLLNTLRPLAKPNNHLEGLFAVRTSIPLQTLRDVTSHSERWSFLYGRLRYMFETGIVPIEWVSDQDLIVCWNRVVESITQQDDYAREAEDLLRTIVALTYGCVLVQLDDCVHTLRLRIRANPDSLKMSSRADPCKPEHDDHLAREDYTTQQSDKAITNAISNLITVILSVALVLPEGGGSAATAYFSSTGRTLLALAIDSYRHQLVAYTSTGSELCFMSVTRSCLPLLANAIFSKSREGNPVSGELCQSLSSGYAKIARIVGLPDDLASFMCSVAHCCEQVGTRPSLQYMQSMLQSVLDLASSTFCSAPAQHSMQRLAIGAAFEFAEHTNKREHLDWALELEEGVDLNCVESNARGRAGVRVRLPERQANGFRWEEGICEWVAKTPALVKIKPSVCLLTDEPTPLDMEITQAHAMIASPLHPERCSEMTKSPARQHLVPSAGGQTPARHFLCVRIDDLRCRETGCHDDGGTRLSIVRRKDGNGGLNRHAASALLKCSVDIDGDDGMVELDARRRRSAPRRSTRPKLIDVTNHGGSGLVRHGVRPGFGKRPNFGKRYGFGKRQRKRESSTLSLTPSRGQKGPEDPGCTGQENVSEDELAV